MVRTRTWDCAKPADGEVTTSVPNLIQVYQNALRHITDIKNLKTPK